MGSDVSPFAKLDPRPDAISAAAASKPVRPDVRPHSMKARWSNSTRPISSAALPRAALAAMAAPRSSSTTEGVPRRDEADTSAAIISEMLRPPLAGSQAMVDVTGVPSSVTATSVVPIDCRAPDALKA